jgi:hypothetical protein
MIPTQNHQARVEGAIRLDREDHESSLPLMVGRGTSLCTTLPSGTHVAQPLVRTVVAGAHFGWVERYFRATDKVHFYSARAFFLPKPRIGVEWVHVPYNAIYVLWPQ